MAKVVADITMSLDGFVTGPDPGPERGLGRGAESLHAWVTSDDGVDGDVLREVAQAPGAVVMGRRLFDVVDGPYGWSDEMGYGGRFATRPRFFVVTHAPPERTRHDLDLDLNFTFVTDGPASAIDQARTAAGDRDVYVMGGADVVRQCVDQALADELLIHLAPLLLGSGTPLLTACHHRRLVQRDVRVSPNATHITYAVRS
ncbi:dihydrofolate reductase family protein [Streptomyces nanshensis]|uniref:DNA-binding protein n=1 Tax=Streptomyces nanshensis TaxID=518642 RepID=A0A1E7L4M1_9ACTN|nr:dihydrofolate reductase family protein [Streptomyces nanshensis]OEV11129.1 DNA-binding protein [Streptomyces nanshensis]